MSKPDQKGGEVQESLRMLIFLELVQAQDAGSSVERSRAELAAKYRLSLPQIIAIENEGLAASWAPL
jgi:hypothetical protein